MMEVTKRAKKPNFSDNEIATLLTEVSLHYVILVSKLQTSVTVAKKKRIWGDITNKVNAVGGNARDAEAVKKKWKDLKSAVLAKKASATKTGGGKPPTPLPYEDNIWQIMGSDSALPTGVDGGLESTLDNLAQQTIAEYDQQQVAVIKTVDSSVERSAGSATCSQSQCTSGNKSPQSPLPEDWSFCHLQSTPRSTVSARHLSCAPMSHLQDCTILDAEADEQGNITFASTSRDSPVVAPVMVARKRHFEESKVGYQGGKQKKKKMRDEMADQYEETDNNSLWCQYLHTEIEKNKAKTEQLKESKEVLKEKKEVLKLTAKEILLHIRKLEKDLE